MKKITLLLMLFVSYCGFAQFPAPYCGPIAFTTNVEPITLVEFAGINNSSTATAAVASGAHEDYTAVFGSVFAGSSYSITLKGNTDGNFTNRFMVFADWNQDGDFADANEAYTITQTILNSTGVDDIFATQLLTVPGSALAGNTRMRVKKIFGTANYTDPCLGAGYGQVEDYSLTVSLPSCATPSAGIATVTSSTTADLSWTSGGAANAEVKIQPAGTGVPATANDTGVNVTGNTYAASSLSPMTAYEFYVRDECTDATNLSSWSGPFTFNTTLAPGCASNLVPVNGSTTVSPGTVTFSWDAPTTGDPATSYDLYYGLTAGNATILVGNFTTTSTPIDITGYNTTFYWKVVPKNAGGSAVGCSESSFTTIAPPGYCLSAPNGQWPGGTTGYTPATCDGLTENSITTAGYAGEYSLVNVVSGETYTFKSSIATDLITISADDGATAAAYGTTPVTWVSTLTGQVRFYTHADTDCTDNTDSRTRIVVCGVASTDSPDYVSLQWPPTATIPQGGSVNVYGQVYEGGLTDVAPNINGQAPGINAWVGYSTTNSNPNTWTNWVAATHNGNSIGNNDEYEANIGATLAPGTYYYATRFNLNNGAYVYGGINQSSPNNGNFWDGTTFVNGILTVTPPPVPANDECSSATALTVGGTYAAQLTDGTTLGATDSTQAAPTTCFGFDGGDVWYSVVVPASGSLTIETGDSTTGATGLDTVITIYSGDCAVLTQVDCDDDGASTGSYSFKSLTNLTPGATLYIRVYEYNNDNTGGFGISAYDASLSNGSFDNANFTFYPNPVKNVLNLSYNQEITSVEVFNMVGQKVSSNNLNATLGQVDMSQLPNGIYLVKVATANNQSKTIRVIKE
jgi:hypothetical protein